LLSLAKRFGKPRLEAGCTLALQIGACQYVIDDRSRLPVM
jgi:hypothetical protein